MGARLADAWTVLVRAGVLSATATGEPGPADCGGGGGLWVLLLRPPGAAAASFRNRGGHVSGGSGDDDRLGAARPILPHSIRRPPLPLSMRGKGGC